MNGLLLASVVLMMVTVAALGYAGREPRVYYNGERLECNRDSFKHWTCGPEIVGAR